MVLSTLTALRFLHLLATVTWIGGMLFTNLVLMPALAVIDPPQRGKLLGAVAKRFSMLAWASVAVLLVTGLLIARAYGLLFNLSTASGVMLGIKHLVVVSMVAIGLVVTLVISPRLQSMAGPPGQPPTPDFLRAQRQLSLLGQINMILGVVVLFLTIIL